MQKVHERVEWGFSIAVSSGLFAHLQIWLDLPTEIFHSAWAFTEVSVVLYGQKGP